MKRLTKNVFSVLLIMTMLQGCIKEDLADCTFSVSLNFENTNDCRIATSYPEGIHNISIFAFDQSGLFVEQFMMQDTNNPLPSEMSISLLQGTYTLVIWAGVASEQLMDNTFIKGITPIKDLYIRSYAMENGNMTNSNNVYYGILKDFIITTSRAKPQKINLKQNTKPLNIKVTGINHNDNYQISISHNAVNYAFDNTIKSIPSEDATIKQLIESSVPGIYNARDILQWPMAVAAPQLSIQNLNTGAIIFTVTIADLLEQLSQVDFNCQPVINIEINYLADNHITVLVNDWDIIDANGEI